MLACSFAFVSCGQSGDSATSVVGKKNTPSAVVEKSLKDLQNKDYKAALMQTEGIDAASEEDIVALAELAKALYESNGGLTDYEILGEEIAEDGQSATVKTKYTFGNGEVKEDTEFLILTENGWKMKMM